MNSKKYKLENVRKHLFFRGKVLNPPVWVWSHPGGKPNFGDSIFGMIVEALVGRPVERVRSEFCGVPRLLPGGSVLHRATSYDVVWGAGLHNPLFHYNFIKPKNLDIRGVRGPISSVLMQHWLQIEAPLAIGDPAMLLPVLFPAFSAADKKHHCGIVGHFLDNSFGGLSADIKIIDPLREPNDVINDILSCDFIVSSSLHGVIVAESFGIPARWYNPPGLIEPTFKFYDYYLHTGRAPEPATTLEQAFKLGGQNLYTNLDLNILIETFPFELFP